MITEMMPVNQEVPSSYAIGISPQRNLFKVTAVIVEEHSTTSPHSLRKSPYFGRSFRDY